MNRSLWQEANDLKEKKNQTERTQIAEEIRQQPSAEDIAADSARTRWGNVTPPQKPVK